MARSLNKIIEQNGGFLLGTTGYSLCHIDCSCFIHYSFCKARTARTVCMYTTFYQGVCTDLDRPNNSLLEDQRRVVMRVLNPHHDVCSVPIHVGGVHHVAPGGLGIVAQGRGGHGGHGEPRGARRALVAGWGGGVVGARGGRGGLVGAGAGGGLEAAGWTWSG